MKKIMGALLTLVGLTVGVYVGLYLCFIGGIIQIVEAIKSPDISAASIAWGIVKIVFAGFAGGFSAIVLIIPGQILFRSR